jgi:hypothetical protein
LALGHGVVFPSPCPILEIASWDLSGPPSMPDCVRRSLTNLKRCPAWQQCGSVVHVNLEYDAFDDTLLGPVLGALAPLGDKEVHLYMKTPDAGVGASEVQQLGGALGSSLKQLVLQECELSDDYWPAVWAHLSGLQQLSIWDGARGAVGAQDLAFFCSRATHPLQLILGPELHQHVGGKLERQCQLWGVCQVAVAEAFT